MSLPYVADLGHLPGTVHALEHLSLEARDAVRLAGSASDALGVVAEDGYVVG